MQLLGNTDAEKQAYKQALREEKRTAGASFDLDSFNKEWCAVHGIEFPQAVAVTPSQDIKEDHTETIERVTGDILSGDDVGGAGDKLRDIVRDIVGAIEAYKVEREITTFSKVKNGTLQFSACLSSVCDNVVKPSRILKRVPYSDNNANGSVLSNNNAYDADILIKFIDVCIRLCGREGLCFNRALYMALTGVSDEYLRGSLGRLTSARVGLWEKVLNAERTQSLNFAYNSDIGNMRNLNEGEALLHHEKMDAGAPVGLSVLRRLDG